jgi:hypothetical protein
VGYIKIKSRIKINIEVFSKIKPRNKTNLKSLIKLINLTSLYKFTRIELGFFIKSAGRIKKILIRLKPIIYGFEIFKTRPNPARN